MERKEGINKGHVEYAPASGVLQEILTHGRKGIQQGARFQAEAAVHNMRLFVERIAGAHHAFLFTDGELKFAG